MVLSWAMVQPLTLISLHLYCRAGAAAEGGEVELGSKALGNAALTTRERMRRDRELHRLGLNLVERIPSDVLVDLVQVNFFLSSSPSPCLCTGSHACLCCYNLVLVTLHSM